MIKKYYNGILELKNAAGFRISIQGEKVTEEEIIKTLKDFYKREGRSPKAQEMSSKYGLLSRSKIIAAFGSYAGAKEAAGLPVLKKQGSFYDKVEVDNRKRIQEKLGYLSPVEYEEQLKNEIKINRVS